MKNSKIKINTPWLNADGTKKTDNEIELLGQSWSAETWNLYLDSSIGTIQDTRLSFLQDMDTDEMLKRSEVIEYLEEGSHYKKLKIALRLALEKLSRSERIIIEKSFWGRQTDKEIAYNLNKTHKNVRVLKSRALQKLRKILISTKLKNHLKDIANSEIQHLQKEQRKHTLTSDSLTFR